MEFPDLNNGTGLLDELSRREAMHAPKRERTAPWLTARRLDTIERSPLAMRHDVICYFSDVKSPLGPRSPRSPRPSRLQSCAFHASEGQLYERRNPLQCFLFFISS